MLLELTEKNAGTSRLKLVLQAAQITADAEVEAAKMQAEAQEAAAKKSSGQVDMMGSIIRLCCQYWYWTTKRREYKERVSSP